MDFSGGFVHQMPSESIGGVGEKEEGVEGAGLLWILGRVTGGGGFYVLEPRGQLSLPTSGGLEGMAWEE